MAFPFALEVVIAQHLSVIGDKADRRRGAQLLLVCSVIV
jgi:hypothetical protein